MTLSSLLDALTFRALGSPLKAALCVFATVSLLAAANAIVGPKLSRLNS